MDSRDGSSAIKKIIHRSLKFMWNIRRLMCFIFFCFLLSRYAVFSAILILKLLQIIDMSRTMDSPTTPGSFFDCLRSFVSPDLAIIPTFLLLSSLFTLILIYTVETNLKEPEITLKNLMIHIWKKLKNLGAAPKLFVCFLSGGYLSFSLSLVLAALLLRSLSPGFYLLASVVTLSGAVLLVYFDFFWFQRALTSVMEAGCQGWTTTTNPEAEIEGRKISSQSSTHRLIILSYLIGFFNTSPLYLFVDGVVASCVHLFNLSVVIPSVGVFELAVQALFYVKWTSERAKELVMEEKGIYDRVSSTAPSIEDIPV